MSNRDPAVEKLLKRYPVILDWPVAWRDMDAFDHVNNVRYFEYFEHVRVHYGGKLDLVKNMKATGVGPIIAEARITFIRPVRYPDVLSLGVRVSKVEPTQWKMDFRAVSQAQKALVVKGESITVFFDYNRNERTRVPDFIMKKLEELEGKKFDIEAPKV